MGRTPRWAGTAAALELAYQVDGLVDRAEALRAVGEVLLRLVPADVVGWNAVDVVAGTAEIAVLPEDPWDVPAVAAGLAEVAAVHPMLTSYLRPDDDLAPRRLSDVATRAELARNPAYVEFLRPLGAEHQLTVMTARVSGRGGRGWALNRSGPDFTARDMEVADALQAVLVLLDRTLGTPPPPTAAAEGVRLTPREVQVLGHVAAGLTAEAVARLLRISALTVRKHLENAYRKLGCSDRLLAVQRARALGILPGPRPGSTPSPGGAMPVG
jgi:DNA-binding CsgD family transcriptional regulator